MRRNDFTVFVDYYFYYDYPRHMHSDGCFRISRRRQRERGAVENALRDRLQDPRSKLRGRFSFQINPRTVAANRAVQLRRNQCNL
jgi:hypothetical protein